MLSLVVVTCCCHLMLSLVVVTCYHLMLSLVVTWCCHLFLSLVVVTCCHLMLSLDVVTCCHLILSLVVVTWCCHLMLKPHGIIRAHKPSHTLKSILCNPKDTIKIEERSDVVSKIPCSNCDMCYIGETSQQVKFRVEEQGNNITQHHQPSLIYQTTNILLHGTPRHKLEQCSHFE